MFAAWNGCLVVLFAACATGGPAESVPYDRQSGRWLFDPEAIVSRNDVLYVTPSVEPWEAMPVGGGDLSAMVRCDGTAVDLHLTKSDAWGFQTPPDAPPGSRFFNNVSPGHVRLRFGPGAESLRAERFRQRLDLYRGRVVLGLGPETSGAQLVIWGHPERKILVVEVFDPHGALGPVGVELSEWRPTMKLEASSETLRASEIHTRAARPHLANTGMQDYFDSSADPLLGRGTAVAVATKGADVQGASADEKRASMRIDVERPSHWYVVIAAAVTPHGDPGEAASAELDGALRTPLARLKAEQEKWWRAWWDRSFLRVGSPDRTADRLCAAYHVNLYTLGCVNRGPVPCKWDGGPGLMRGDERTWGLAEWVQEIRFTYLPLYAANRLQMTRGLTRHYSQMQPYLLEQTRRMWGVEGLWIPETVLPWGHAEDLVLEDAGQSGHFLPWDPKTARYGRFERYNGYVGFLFTSGLEICHHYLLDYRYSGDEAFLRDEAYPVLRGVCRFLSELLRKEDDGRYHLDPANALETWWMVRDPADTLAGVRAIFPEFIRLSEAYGADAELRARCGDVLAQLPEPAFGHWARDGDVDPDAKTYAPAAAKERFPTARNFEIPALYRVYPFGLSGIDAPDYELVRATFERRIFGITNSWSLDAVWAARLGLHEQAGRLLAEHAVRYNRFRYGGWDSSNSSVFPDGLSVVPYMDGAGLSAFGVNEVLLQSHGGLIRVLPAVPDGWSGIFRLRAEGSFLVAADFAEGKPRFVEVISLGGRKCRIRNPWNAACVVRRGGRIVLSTDDPIIEFDTAATTRYLLEPI